MDLLLKLGDMVENVEFQGKERQEFIYTLSIWALGNGNHDSPVYE